MAEKVTAWNRGGNGKSTVVVVLAKKGVGNDAEAYMVDDDNPIPISKSDIITQDYIAAESMGANINGLAVDTSKVDNIGIMMSWTGTPVGVLAVQYSHDGTTWRDYDFDPALTQPSGSSGHTEAVIFQTPFPKLRVTYTRTSGTGALTVSIDAKGS